MLTGKKPFEAGDLVKLMAMQVTAPPPPFASVGADASVPAALQAAVMRALEKERERRFGTAAEFREALERAEGAGSPSVDAWAHLGRAAGPALWAGLGTLRVALGWLRRQLARATRSLIARLPLRARRWVKPAAALVIMGFVVALLTAIVTAAAPELAAPEAQTGGAGDEIAHQADRSRHGRGPCCRGPHPRHTADLRAPPTWREYATCWGIWSSPTKNPARDFRPMKRHCAWMRGCAVTPLCWLTCGTCCRTRSSPAAHLTSW